MSDIILEMKNITKTFPGVKALDDVNLLVRRGEIHALCGENGAGKSTLMNVLSGIYPYGSYEGEIILNGELARFQTIRDSEEKGIVIIHQELAMIPFLDIAENMFLGNEQGRKYAIDWELAHDKAITQMRQVGLHESPYTLVRDISVGKQQLLEIAKALAKNVDLLILDEPTASLNDDDAEKLLKLLLKLKAERGLTSIIISHKLNEISYVADQITIIRDGKTIETLDNSQRKVDEAHIVSCMVGRALSDRFPKRPKCEVGETLLEVRNWTVHHPLQSDRKVVDGASLKVKRGEVVGIAGLMGAGRTELAMSLFGRSYGAHITGDLYLRGKKANLDTVKQAIDQKLAYVTEDRKGNGLILSNPIYINTSMAKMDKISRHGVIDQHMERKVAKHYIERLRTKCSSIDQFVGNLSGGNQQKVLLSKWMFADPDILILDEPTRGIDVGAKYEIYTIINELVEDGKAVLLISSEMPELIGMCDRIYVMSDGKIRGELSRGEATQELIMSYILQTGRPNSAEPSEQDA